MRAFAESSTESCTAMVCSCRLIYLRSGLWIKSSGVEWRSVMVYSVGLPHRHADKHVLSKGTHASASVCFLCKFLGDPL